MMKRYVEGEDRSQCVLFSEKLDDNFGEDNAGLLCFCDIGLGNSMEVRESLPLSGAGKVLKTELRAPYWQEQQRRVG